MRRTLRAILLVAVIPAALALFSDTSWAQRGHSSGGHPSGGQPPSAGARPPAGAPPAGAGHPGPGPSHGPSRGPVYGSAHVGGYYGYGYGYYGYPYWGFGWGYPFYGPWGYPYWGGGYGYGYPYYDPSPEIRLEVKPKEAQVYVDGYYAGVVDDFDGTFQRLRLRPGTHELVLYFQGFHTVQQNIHVGSGQDLKIKFQMQPLAAGETNEPPPQPKAAPAEDQPQGAVQGYPPQGYPPQNPPQGPPARRPAPVEQGGAKQGQAFGSLVVRVQPSGAEVLVDGERWQGPEGSERLVIQVSEGSHRIEVRKEGFVPFSTTVQVRRGETSPLNVSLPPRGE